MIKKHLYQILLVLLLFSLLSVVYLPIRRNIVGQLEKVKISLISGWEKEYELQVKYRSISPTIINSLRIREFFLRGDRGISFTFTSDRISIFYGLKLFTREKSRINLRRIVIRGGTLDLTLPEGEGWR